MTIQVRCPYCSAENTAGNRFCQSCGRTLAERPDPMASGRPEIATASVAGVRPEVPPMEAASVARTSMGWAVGSDAGGYVAPAPVASGTTSWATMRGPFAARGSTIESGSAIYTGKAGEVAAAQAALTQALAPFRPYPEYFDGLSARMERRVYLTATRGAATVAIYTTAIGRDLYASWTMLCHRNIDVLRLIGLGLLALLLALPGGLQVDLFGLSGGSRFEFGSFLRSVVIWVVVLAAITLWAGLTFRRDLLGYLRAPLNEFQRDDVTALRQLVEKTLRGWAGAA